MDYSLSTDYDHWHRQADWIRFEELIPTEEPGDPPVPPICPQCAHWQDERTLQTIFGIQRVPGYCSLRASADLTQMPQNYAPKCSLYVEACPF